MNTHQQQTTDTHSPSPSFDIFNNPTNITIYPPICTHTTIPQSLISPHSFKIATHNVQGLNTITKQQLWTEYCHNNNYDIISITETKLSENSWHNTSLSNSVYLFFISNNNLSSSTCTQQSSLGTAIMIRPI